MSSPQEVRATLEEYAAAWSKGDSRAIADLYADDIVFNYLGRHALAGRHEGKPRAMGALREFNLRTGRRLKSVTDILVGDASGALLVQEYMGPDQWQVARMLVYTVSSNRLHSCTIFDESQHLIDALVGDAPWTENR